LTRKVVGLPQTDGNVRLIPAITKRDYWFLKLVDHTQPHSVNQAMPTLVSNWSVFPMEPYLRPSRFLSKSAMNIRTIADRTHNLFSPRLTNKET